MVQTTSQGFDEHLNEISARFRTLHLPKATSNSAASSPAHYLDNKYEDINKCLSTCTQVFSYIQELQLYHRPKFEHGSDDLSACLPSNNFSNADTITFSTLKECNDLLSNLRCWLHTYQEQGHDQQVGGTLPLPQEKEGTERETITTNDSVSERLYPISCSDAEEATPGGVYLENITIGSGGQQILVSTIGQLFSARHIVVGDRSTQFIGSCSDASFQQYLKTLGRE